MVCAMGKARRKPTKPRRARPQAPESLYVLRRNLFRPTSLGGERQMARADDPPKFWDDYQPFVPVAYLPPKLRNSPKKVSAPKRKTKRGSQSVFDRDGEITAAMKRVADKALDDKQSIYIDRVVQELKDRHIFVPGPTWMKKHAGAYYKARKAAGR
jgi:hypothetical protein